MTYLTFLILFVALPAAALTLIFRQSLSARWWSAIGLIAVVALVWTTPWDNFLVARGVWWYEPKLVLGAIIGYVPLEEYCFFVLQTVLTGVLLARLIQTQKARLPITHFHHIPAALLMIAALAIGVFVMLVSGNQRLNYLILKLGWLALVPFAAQWLFGLDILLARWRVVLVGILLPTLWLTAMDAVALRAGTWTIDPAQTTGIFLPGGIVPIEEGLFFLITNALIVQGLVLLTAPETWLRAESLWARLRKRWHEAR